jgi:outer membrane protein TolC
VIIADAELAARERDLVIAQSNLRLRQADLKNLLSKKHDASLDAAEIETSTALSNPKDEDVPQLGDALLLAMQERPEIRLGNSNIVNQAIAVRYAGSLMKPTLTVFGVLGSAGLGGDRLVANPLGGSPILVPGGLWQALGHLRRFNYPEYAFGFSFSMPLGNQSARADSARARLDQRDAETSLQRTRNQVELDVRRALIALIQAKAQVEAARAAAMLSAQISAAEEDRLLAGVSTAYDVIRRQRDLLAAQLAEVQARVAYAKSLVELRRATGILDR